VEILVNNAGITRDGLMMAMKRADWDDVLGTNLTGSISADAGRPAADAEEPLGTDHQYIERCRDGPGRRAR
jgi:NAD(P)-dependent dehydrogenase (short-subunit alcohol dehydrogenase family)